MSEPRRARSAIVTGGGSGIGLATARALLEAGLEVAILDLRAGEEAAGLQARAAELDSRLSFQEADVSAPQSVEAAVAAASAELGGVDALVNSAGVHLSRSALE